VSPGRDVDRLGRRAGGGVRKHKRRVIYLTDYEKSFPIASERRHRKPISLVAAFGVCTILSLAPVRNYHPLCLRLGPRWRRGPKSAERFPSKYHLFPRRFPRSSFSFKGDVLLIESPAGRIIVPPFYAEYSLNKIGWFLARIDTSKKEEECVLYSAIFARP